MRSESGADFVLAQSVESCRVLKFILAANNIDHIVDVDNLASFPSQLHFKS